jgi:LacI family transcriptional regulator
MQSSIYFVSVMEAAAKMGYLVLTSILSDLADEENLEIVKRIFYQERIDAGIFIGVNNNEPLLEELIQRGKVVGVFDHFKPGYMERNRISLNFENETGGKMIDYVYEMGHRKIAVLDGNLNRFSSVKRHEGFIVAMQKHNIEIKSNWMYYAGITEIEGYKAAKALLGNCDGEYPTIICCNNDSVAIGAYKALEEMGFSIPKQISIIGIDGHKRGEYISPPLTTFAFDYGMFFSSLVTRVIGAVENKEGNRVIDFIPSTLVERKSVRRLTTDN